MSEVQFPIAVVGASQVAQWQRMLLPMQETYETRF